MNRLRVQHHSLFLQERHQHGVEAAFLINEDIDVFCIADDLADFPRGLMDFWKAVLIHPDGITDKLNVDEVPEEQEKQIDREHDDPEGQHGVGQHDQRQWNDNDQRDEKTRILDRVTKFFQICGHDFPHHG